MLEYNSDHEIGTEEFNSEFSGIGVYSGIIDETRTAYEIDWTANDATGETYHQHVRNDLSKDYLNGNISQGEMRTEIHFNKLWID
jgi:hypothetical protein